MPRGKQGPPGHRDRAGRGSRGAGRGGSRGGFRGRGRIADASTKPTYMPSMQTSAAFTMADEARQTSQHDHSSWSLDSNLRSRPICFRSVGMSEPLKVHDEAQPNDDAESSAQAGVAEEYQRRNDFTLTFEHPQPPTDCHKEENIIGIEGHDQDEQIPAQENHQGTFATATPFFYDLQGDKSSCGPQKKIHIPVPQRRFSSISSSSDEVILFRGRNGNHSVQAPPEASDPVAGKVPPIGKTQQPGHFKSIAYRPPPKASMMHLPIRPKRSGRRLPEKDGDQGKKIGEDDDALLADYIANMRENGELDEAAHWLPRIQRDLGGTESDLSDQGPRRRSEMQSPACQGDEPPAMGTSRKPRDAGSTQDATHHRDENSQGGANEKHPFQPSSGRRPPSSGHEAERYGSPEAEDNSSVSSLDDMDLPAGQAGNGTEFDFMNWERPSLRRRKGKNYHSELAFEGYDSGMERQVLEAWKKDRFKKKQRKQQREELRALGLLGKPPKPNDLIHKYTTGMTIQEVAEELRNFLTSGDDSLSFPPMDLHARMVIHDLANQFKINSKSTGKGDQRRPVLHRTARTTAYQEATFERALSRIRRRYLPRLDVKGKRNSSTPTMTGSSHAATSYRDGEVVGAAAPELGTENRGRAMLEKMGWSSGTALGATHNKGILQPVTQTMKRTKAGLG